MPEGIQFLSVHAYRPTVHVPPLENESSSEITAQHNLDTFVNRNRTNQQTNLH